MVAKARPKIDAAHLLVETNLLNCGNDLNMNLAVNLEPHSPGQSKPGILDRRQALRSKAIERFEWLELFEQ